MVVTYTCNSACFAQKALVGDRITVDAPNFDGSDSVQRQMMRFVNHAHAAASQNTPDAMTNKRAARNQRTTLVTDHRVAHGGWRR